MTRMGVLLKTSNFILYATSALIGILSFFAFILAVQLKSLNSTSPVTLNWKQLFWWSHIEVNFEKPLVNFLPNIPAMEALPQKIRPTHIAQKKRPIKISKKISNKNPSVIKNNTAILLAMHQLLKSRFLWAVNTQDSLNIQLASAQVTPKVKKQNKQPPKRADLRMAPPAHLEKTTQTANPTALAALFTSAIRTTLPAQDEISIKIAAPLLDPLPLDPRPLAAHRGSGQDGQKSKVFKLNKPEKSISETNNVKEDAPLIIASSKIANPDLNTQSLTTQKLGSQKNEYSGQSAQNLEPNAKPAQTPLGSQGAPQDPTGATTGKTEEKTNLVISNIKCQNSQLPQQYLCAIDAFSPWEEPFAAKTEILSYEGFSAHSKHERWVSAKKDEFLGTHFYRFSDDSNDPIPMISNNAALLLAKWAGVTLQKTAGMVVGQLPAGWGLEISGRAESPVYLDEKRQLVSTPFNGKNHTFAFLNAAPGTQLLTLKKANGELGPSIALPVTEGFATYVQLGQPVKQSLSGRVLDASSYKQRGIPNIQVRIIGHDSQTVITRPDGSFSIEKVYSIPGYPLYFETDGKSGFTHRYRISVKYLKPVYLFRFHPFQVQRWISQVSHELSDESALLITALPDLVSKNEEKALYPRLSPLLTPAPLNPQTYTLDREEWLLTHVPLKKESPRFLGIQIPEGINICKVEDKENKIYWSELVFTSPRVINVIVEN